MSITPDLAAARRVLSALANPNNQNSMKQTTLDSHDRALAAVITAQNAAADAIGKRQTAAQAIVASFAASPSEQGLAQAIAAQNELAALAKIADALPDPSRREQALRDRYTVQNRDALLDILTADLSARLKPRPAWRRSIAAQIARLSETLALREAPQAELAAASNEADRLDGTLAASDHAEREARRSIADFANAPSFTTLNDARGIIGTLNF
jgi:hypothetical protein